MENYPDEFTMLYQRPQADMAGMDTCKNIESVRCQIPRCARDLFWLDYISSVGAIQIQAEPALCELCVDAFLVETMKAVWLGLSVLLSG